MYSYKTENKKLLVQFKLVKIIAIMIRNMRIYLLMCNINYKNR